MSPKDLETLRELCGWAVNDASQVIHELNRGIKGQEMNIEDLQKKLKCISTWAMFTHDKLNSLK